MKWSAAGVTAAAALVVGLVAPGFLAMRTPDAIYPGPGVARTGRLSDYLPALAGTAGDTPVFYMEGWKSGATALVLGGTHADEPAGYLSAVVLIERARVDTGRLIVIPRANASGFTQNVPQEAHPNHITIRTSRGDRRFTYGARATNPVHQWPDPQVYVLPGSGQELSGSETRNLNRAYPGLAGGSLTERIAWAITTLIRNEKVDLAIDLHEASPEYPVVNTMVAHDRAVDLAALANMNLQGAGIVIGLETSPANLHGLSHREWGDSTQAIAILMETTNPAQGRLRGRTDEALVTAGRDRFYVAASERNRLSVPFPESGWPLQLRVARHLAGIRQLLDDYSALHPETSVGLREIPEYHEIVNAGIGASLH